MLSDTEGGKDVVKIEGRKLWIEDLKAEESGVVVYCTHNLQVCSSTVQSCNNSGVCDTEKRLDEFYCVTRTKAFNMHL